MMLGEKLSIVNAKAQTTRQRIFGIYNEDDLQIVFSDTPGIIKPAYKLQEGMMHFVKTALQDADVFLLIIDVKDADFEYKSILETLKKTSRPVLVILNKIDLIDEERLVEINKNWAEKLGNAEIIPLSALKKFNVDYLLKRIKELLPENPPYFDKEALSDKPVRFFVSEMIREKILDIYRKEVPYSVEVLIETFKEAEKIIRIRAVILVIRDTQKAIIIGHKGEKIKRLGIAARKEIEAFLGKQVYLELFVKVDKNWRNDERKLRRYGYWQK